MDAIFERMSIRRYEDKPVEPEKVEQLLRAAMAAPSAHNQQPWEFYVVTDKETIAKLSEVTPYAQPAGRAPLVIVPCYATDRLRCPEFAHIDMSACVENLLVEATAQGLGACWMGIAPHEDRQAMVEEIIGAPSTLRAFCLISVGYPGEAREHADRYDSNKVHNV